MKANKMAVLRLDSSCLTSLNLVTHKNLYLSVKVHQIFSVFVEKFERVLGNVPPDAEAGTFLGEFVAQIVDEILEGIKTRIELQDLLI